MTLSETLLEKLGDWRPAEEVGDGRPAAPIDLDGHGWSVTVAAERFDSLSCLLNGVEATRNSPVAADSVALEAHARKVATRVTGLLEPLRLVEIDRSRDVALLRSDAPPTKGDNVLFYEVQFEGRNRVTVNRYQASKPARASKVAIPFGLTHEVLAKLVDDLVRE
jgi:hypothetical protein